MSDTKKQTAGVPGQAASSEDREVLLKVEGLKKHFPIKKGILQRQVAAVKAVDGIDFEVRKGETLGVAVSRAAASRPWAGSSPGSRTRRVARSTSRARTSRP